MSALWAHARAAQIVAEGFEDQAHPDADPATRDMLLAFAAAYRDAATRMENEIRAELTPPHEDVTSAPTSTRRKT